MIDFPNSPTTGQIYNSGTGPIYIWDGVAWSLVTQATRTARQNNLVVNPAMAVSQELGSTASSVSGAYPVDQWQTVSTGPVCSGQQVSGYTPELSVNRIRKTVTTPKASLAAGDMSGFFQTLEGLRIAMLGYGSAVAIQSVLRVGIKAPAGTYSITMRNSALNRSYVKNFTIAAGQANTDTVQTFVIPGDTTGSWAADNSAAMYLGILDAVGTTYQGTDGVWQAGDIRGTAANSNMVATNGNVVELFDVGLYPDPERTGLPPPFIAPIYSDVLLTCQRYWESGQDGFDGYNTAGAYVSMRSIFKVTKRTTPTVTGTVSGQGNVPAGFTPDFGTPNNFRQAKAAIASGPLGWQQTWQVSARM